MSTKCNGYTVDTSSTLEVSSWRPSAVLYYAVDNRHYLALFELEFGATRQILIIGHPPRPLFSLSDSLPSSPGVLFSSSLRLGLQAFD